jgi:formylglycine-generating enzyme required for sulfatase activity
MKLPADFLQRSGYRLPTEAEWDFACRAGARTRWSWGDEGNPGLGSEYAWTYDNLFVLERMRPFPVARLKPNVFGFFDMHGNVGEWCHDRQDGQGRVLIDDQDIATGVADERKRVQCGGSFVWPVNRESRFGALPHFPSPASGFRPASTLKGLDPPAQGGITK